jgi:hypothetical protein
LTAKTFSKYDVPRDAQTSSQQQETNARPPTEPRLRMSADERHHQIAVHAYQRAAERDFAPGGELEDWLRAEHEVDGAGR